MIKKSFDVELIRQDFPILHQMHHADVPLVYLDNGASSQKPRQVIDAIQTYYMEYNANVHRGIHKLSEQATSAYEGARDKIRQFIHAKSRREIIMTHGTTEGINLVVQTWGRQNLGPNDVVISTVMEHHANIVPWQILQAERGFTIRYVPILDDGTLNLAVYQQFLELGNVKIVAVMHSSNVLGTVNPVQEMATLAHEHGALILVDAAQTSPHILLDVQAMDCDFMVFSGHKMLASTGIGVLYGKREHLEEMPPFMGGGDMISRVTLEGSTWNDLPYKFEAGTPPIAEGISLGVAMDYLQSVGLDAIHAYEQQLVQYAMDRLSEVTGLTVYGKAVERGSVIAFVLDGVHAHDLAQGLDSYGIAVRAGHHCAMPLHQHLQVAATTRASFYLYNTFAEVDRLMEAIWLTKKQLG